jgi:hypothetical protein
VQFDELVLSRGVGDGVAAAKAFGTDRCTGPAGSSARWSGAAGAARPVKVVPATGSGRAGSWPRASRHHRDRRCPDRHRHMPRGRTSVTSLGCARRGQGRVPRESPASIRPSTALCRSCSVRCDSCDSAPPLGAGLHRAGTLPPRH